METESASKKILLADEDSDVRHLLSAFLTIHGFDVITAQNGVDAIVAVTNNDVSAIITEWALPVVDGLRLLNWLRKEIKTPVPVIVLSANEKATSREQIMEAGADAVLYKPASAFDIMSKLRGVLNQEAL